MKIEYVNLIDSLKPVFYTAIGGLIGYYFNRLNIKESERRRVEQQQNIWKKQFDIFQAEPLIKLLKSILMTTQNKFFKDKIITQDQINQLCAEITIISFLKNKAIKSIEKLYSACLEYNNHLESLVSGTNTTEVASDIGDLSSMSDQREEDLRKRIKELVVEITKEIKSIYPKLDS